ncbi:helix-turn-helix domain-containing protein [Niabella aurantiaca]|uniref:helix-turn-helix domain-containing protein n=1 Tax=Niabella aurantiaca TaxID=379900 RepID=UPI00036AF67D|nr:helix-turn-helix transcriptional regulator [Niabella aurantiaca]
MKYFRTQLHLTQQELAFLLGVSQSLLSMYEKDLRELPDRASHKQAQLEWELHQFQQQKSMPDPREALRQQKKMRKLEKLLDNQAREAEEDILRIDEALDKMKERQKQLDLKLAFIKRLMAAGGPWQEDKDLLQNMALGAEVALDGCDPVRQQEVAYKLLLLKARMKAARQIQRVVKQSLNPTASGR